MTPDRNQLVRLAALEAVHSAPDRRAQLARDVADALREMDRACGVDEWTADQYDAEYAAILDKLNELARAGVVA